jgi:hypothetical protein
MAMEELKHTLETLGVIQLLLAFVFVTAYTLALGRMLDERDRWRAAALAFTSAIFFTVFTSPWEHGIMLLAAVVVGIGLFMAMAWIGAEFAGWYVGPETVAMASLLPDETDFADISEVQPVMVTAANDEVRYSPPMAPLSPPGTAAGH